MTTYAVLDQIPLEIVPGTELSCGLTVRNNSDVVEAYEFEVVGDTAPWTVVEPSTLSVYPGSEAAVAVRFQPPRSSRVPAGEVPFAVRVLPSLRPQDAVAPEGVLRVQPFTATTAEITPRTSTGRRRARHEVAIDNRGNVPITAGLAAADPDGQLTLRPNPPAITVAPGAAEFVTIAVRQRRWLWQGTPITRPFQVVVEAEAATDPPLAPDPPIIMDAGTVQQPVIPKGFRRLVMALAALLVLFMAIWFLMLRPAVRSAAKEAVEQPMAEVAQQVDDAGQKAEAAQEKADKVEAATVGGGNGNANGSGNGASPSPSPSGGAAGTTASVPVTVRLQTFLAPSSTPGIDALTVRTRTTLVITDLVLQNPQGDTGRLDVLVNGNPILTLSLANFRDLDYHFVSPIEVPPGRNLSLRTTCQAPGPPIVGTSAGQCRVWMFATGTNRIISA